MNDVSRRGFIRSVGVGAVGAATLRGGPAEVSAAPVAPAGEPMPLALSVNGRLRRVVVEPRTTLLEALRGRLGLSGSKPGCERGECGACTVLIDGVPRYGCLTLAAFCLGEELDDVQKAFVEKDAFQCGYCTSGQVMAVEGFLRRSPDPTLEEIREGVSGNLCRCGAYAHIFEATRRAANLRRGGR